MFVSSNTWLKFCKIFPDVLDDEGNLENLLPILFLTLPIDLLSIPELNFGNNAPGFVN